MAARKGIWCDTDCFWKWTATDCPGKKECVCTTCSGLDAIHPALYENCRLQCNADDKAARPKSPNQFMCEVVGKDQAFLKYNYACGGFDPLKDTAEGRLAAEKNAATAKNAAFMRVAAGIAFAGLLILALISFLPKTEK